MVMPIFWATPVESMSFDVDGADSAKKTADL